MPSNPIRTSPQKTRDRDVRALVLKTVLADHAKDANARIVEELGLEHGSCRVDIAVVNGFLHGFELKSDADNLLRLPRQVEAYSRSMDRATLVVGEEHLTTAVAMLPLWWGIKIVRRSNKGQLKLETHRRLRNNPAPSLFHMAHLMWRTEVEEVLRADGASPKELNVNRAGLYRLFVDSMPPSDVRRNIREALKSRRNWRYHAQPS
jgi:hypothetical protein